MRVRSALIKPLTWSLDSDPTESDSYAAVWFRLRHQRAEYRVEMNPFNEPVRLVLPV